MNQISTDFINRLNDAKMTVSEKRYATWTKIGICLFLYGLTVFFQIRLMSSGVNMSGVIAQLQVMISIYLVIAVKKIGYFIGIAFNILIFSIAAMLVLANGNMGALPGLVLPIGTIAILSIILLYGKGLDSKLAELSEQKEELSALYDELANSEKEVRIQNIQLKEFNNILKERETKLNFLAYMDVLTELPNRKMIVNKLDILVDRSQDEQLNFGVVLIDLDQFKKINKSEGYYIGDILLKEIVAKIQSIIYKEDMLGRLGGDEFALIIRHSLNEEDLFEYVERIRMALLESFTVENLELHVSASFGISLFPRDGKNSKEVLKSANTALRSAKESGVNSVRFFTQ